MLSKKSVELNRATLAASLLLVAMLLTLPCAQAQQYKYETPIPPGITTPDKVETRLGTLKFEGGYPDAATVEKVYDNLDFQRGIEAYLNTMQGASLVAFRRGMREVGAVDGTFGVFNTLMDSKSLFLTANTDTVYAFTWIDLSKGPIVIESPPNSLGIVDDFWFRYVADLGNAGPDKGKGGKYLFLPPGYKGDVPQGYFVFKCRTFGNWFATRGFLVNGDPGPAVESFHKTMRSYPIVGGRQTPPSHVREPLRQGFQHRSSQNAKIQDTERPSRDSGTYDSIIGKCLPMGRSLYKSPASHLRRSVTVSGTKESLLARAASHQTTSAAIASQSHAKSWSTLAPRSRDGKMASTLIPQRSRNSSATPLTLRSHSEYQRVSGTAHMM